MATSLKTLFPTVNAVLLEGDQTIDGVKTFSRSPIVPTPTTATQAVPKTYADGFITTPIFISMLTKVPDAIGQGTWDIVIQSGASGQIYHASFRNALAASSGDNFTVNFSAPAGTYRIDFNAVKGTNMGILDVFVDAVRVLDAYDLYLASPTVLNIASITGVALTAGSHTLKFAINGKNASSRSYVINMSAIQISRTGD
jgi:hypothetical protein